MRFGWVGPGRPVLSATGPRRIPARESSGLSFRKFRFSFPLIFTTSDSGADEDVHCYGKGPPACPDRGRWPLSLSLPLPLGSLRQRETEMHEHLGRAGGLEGGSERGRERGGERAREGGREGLGGRERERGGGGGERGGREGEQISEITS